MAQLKSSRGDINVLLSTVFFEWMDLIYNIPKYNFKAEILINTYLRLQPKQDSLWASYVFGEMCDWTFFLHHSRTGTVALQCLLFGE